MTPPDYFPGTQVKKSDVDLLKGIFTATHGITLSQVCEITGLEPGTIQNWIKRGYVSPPVGRKYTQAHLARIILINMLRETYVIENIAKLLSYVNGNLLDHSDDIMDDSEIYQCICRIVDDNEECIILEKIAAKIDEQLVDYVEPYSGAKTKLKRALEAMVCAWQSAKYKKLAHELTEGI